MTLIKSISGIRGTIGGSPGDNLTPLDIVKFTSAYGHWVQNNTDKLKIIIGRDARPSGPYISEIISNTLVAMGFEVIDLGLSTTPTVEIAVPVEKAGGGIIITASHNPVHWNALKLLNDKGEFLSADEGNELLTFAENDDYQFSDVHKIGRIRTDDTYLQKHIDQILSLPYVDVEAIQKSNFKVIVDGVNSSGGIAVPLLLDSLGIKHIEKLFCEPTGHFPHNPEPVNENVSQICAEVIHGGFDIGIVVDPDVDRLAMISETGDPFGEEYTLVAIAEYILSVKKSDTVTNLSSSQALRVITEKAGMKNHSVAVGEVNVVKKMKEVNAVIGGEGNGGIILPELHYGRDALVGIALFLTALAKSGKSMSQYRASFPSFVISKNKIELTPSMDVDEVLEQIAQKYAHKPQNTEDGIKIEFPDPSRPKVIEWVHLRKSNTEPIIRIYAESDSEATADHLAKKIMMDIKELITASI